MVTGLGGGGRAQEKWLLNRTPAERGGKREGLRQDGRVVRMGQGGKRDPVREAQSCGQGGGTLGTMWLCVDVSVCDYLVSGLCVQSSAGAPLLWSSVMSR